jgi:hypothetical protein
MAAIEMASFRKSHRLPFRLFRLLRALTLEQAHAGAAAFDEFDATSAPLKIDDR